MESTPEQLTEMEMQAAVDEILRTAEFEQRQDEECPTFFVFKYGSKDIEIIYHQNLKTIDHSIETYPDLEKKPRETEALYRAAKRIVQEQIIDKINRELIFLYETHNEKMVEFGKTKGKEIFDWDTVAETEIVDIHEKKRKIWKFTKNFKPQEKL